MHRTARLPLALLVALVAVCLPRTARADNLGSIGDAFWILVVGAAILIVLIGGVVTIVGNLTCGPRTGHGWMMAGYLVGILFAAVGGLLLVGGTSAGLGVVGLGIGGTNLGLAIRSGLRFGPGEPPPPLR